MPWWGWLLVAVSVVVLVTFFLRRHLRYFVKVAKALATDERIPRPLRWGLKFALAIKVVPFPDLGIDEAILVVVGVLLLTICRPALRAILDESRESPPLSP